MSGGEEIPLLELGTIEEIGLEIDAVPGGLPVGVTIGVLGLLGFGAYEVKNFIVDVYKQYHSTATVERKIQHTLKNPKAVLPVWEKLRDSRGKPGFNFPGTKYLGPGNDINRGEALSAPDRTAQIHDIQYEVASSPQDIHTADKQGKESFKYNFYDALSQPGNIQEVYQSGVGYAGLAAKQGIENTFGDIYPNFSGKCLNQISGHLQLMIWMLIVLYQVIKGQVLGSIIRLLRNK